MSLPPPPTSMTVARARKYMEEKYGHIVSRQTFYNYMDVGLRNETLEYTNVPATATCRYTHSRRITRRALDTFFDRCGIDFGRNRHADATPKPKARRPRKHTTRMEQSGGETVSPVRESEEYVESMDDVPEGR